MSNKYPDQELAEWGESRGINVLLTEVAKLLEEAGELAGALIRNNDEESKDALGDIFNVLCQIARIKGYSLCDCTWSVYREVLTRKGITLGNGNFVKDEPINPHSVTTNLIRTSSAAEIQERIDRHASNCVILNTDLDNKIAKATEKKL